MRRLLFLVLFFVGAALAPAYAALAVKPIDIGKTIDVWFAEDHTLPIVAMSFSFPAGSAYDPGDRPGLASFAASLIDEGAGNLNSRAYHGALADRAIRFRAQTERDYMVVTVSTLKENLPEALRLLQLALTRPRFDADAVSRVRTQIIQSIEQDQTEPPNVARRAFMRAFFNGHPYGHDPDGEISSIFAITPEELKTFARSHWVKNGMKIAIAGDVTQPEATKLLAEAFKPVSGAAAPAPPSVGRLGQPGLHVTPLPVPQPTVVFGLPGIMRNDPDFMPGYVANYILGGGGFSSRLTDEVRVKRGLTYGITTQLSPLRRASVMVGSVATRADAVRQTIDVVKQTMASFAASGPTQQELNDAKTYLTGSYPLGFASDSGIANQLGTFQRQGLDIGYVARRNALIDAVTLDQVKRVAKKLFDPARLTVVVAGNIQDGRTPTRPAAPVRPEPAAPQPGPSNGAAGPAASTPNPPKTTPAAKPAIKPIAPPKKP